MGMEEVKKGGFPGLIILYTQSFAKQDNYFSMQKISHWGGKKKNKKLAFEKNRTAEQFIYYTFFPLGFIFIKVCCCFVFKLEK